MNIAILTNRQNSFYKPIAEGLQRMIRSIGREASVFYDGLDLIDYHYHFKAFEGKPLHFISANLKRIRKREKQKNFFRALGTFDLVIVVANIPFAFLRERLSGIDHMRQFYPEIPIVQYNSYLPLSGKGPLYQEYFGSPANGKAYGLERFDHYLIINLSTPQILKGTEKAVAEIGCHLNDESLYPDQNEFIALLDFEKEGKEYERAIQLDALRRTNTKYIELKGTYRIDEIREIYRKTSMYFIAFQESFGFPICELQACGSMIFSPYRSWLYSHSLKTDLSKPGFGSFTDNFVIYNNDLDFLCEKILECRAQHDPEMVRDRFLQHQGHFFEGAPNRLKKFLDAVDSGEISGSSHLENEALNAFIDPQDYCEPPY